MKWFEKIRDKREAMGLSQSDLAKAVDVSQAAINKIENGGVLKTRFLPRIAKRLDIPLAELDADYAAEFARPVIQQSQIQEYGPRLLSGHGLTDPNGDTDLLCSHLRTDGYLTVFTNPIGRIFRPSFLSHFKNLSAFLIDGSDMAPEFETGDIAFGTTELSPVEESTCLFVSAKFNTPDATFCKIRRVTHISDDAWAVRSWQSKKREDDNEILLKKDWTIGLLMVAKYYGRYGFHPADPNLFRD